VYAVCVCMRAEQATACPKLALFQALQAVIAAHPSPTELRRALLADLHALARTTLPASDAGAAVFGAERHLLALDGPLAGEALVDGLRAASEELGAVPGAQDAYADFVRSWVEKEGLDESLVGWVGGRIHSTSD
jgi:U3 small nucleolar RNA-associated protein 6